MSLLRVLLDRIRSAGPMTVAEFMETALYHPDLGYYVSASRRSGREGDFYTSVDVGPLYGELLSGLVVRVWERLGHDAFTFCEAGAGSGRLARDVLDALAHEAPGCYGALRLALVERSPAARAAQPATLGPHAARLDWSAERLLPSFEGVLVANELLDALPVHRVVMRASGWREVYVENDGTALALCEGPLSTQALDAHLGGLESDVPPGTVVDVSLAALDWIAEAARSLRRGLVVLVDYGHDAAALTSLGQGAGTLRAYARHRVEPAAGADDRRPGWLRAPGRQDLTAHVDFAAARAAAVQAGLEVVAFVDQTRFLLGLGLGDRLAPATSSALADVRRRLAATALASPDGLGGSHRVLLLGRGVAGVWSAGACGLLGRA